MRLSYEMKAEYFVQELLVSGLKTRTNGPNVYANLRTYTSVNLRSDLPR